jgi:hypothetical protein
MGAMSRNAIAREEKIFFAKFKKREIEKTAKSENESSPEFLRMSNRIAEAKTRLFNPPRTDGKSDRRYYRNARQLWHPGRSPVHLPVDASSFNEEIEPSLPDGPTFLRRSVVGSISNRGRNYEPTRLRSFCG